MLTENNDPQEAYSEHTEIIAKVPDKPLRHSRKGMLFSRESVPPTKNAKWQMRTNVKESCKNDWVQGCANPDLIVDATDSQRS